MNTQHCLFFLLTLLSTLWLQPATAKDISCPGISFSATEIHVTSGVHAAGEVISRPKSVGKCKLGAGSIWYHYRIYNDQVSSGQTYNDGVNSYTIWKTQLPGIGYIVNAYYESGEAVGGRQSGNLPITEPMTDVRASFPRIISWANAKPTITLVTTGEAVILPGEYDGTLPAVRYVASYSGTSTGAQATFNLHFRFGVAAQVCTPSASSYTVNMGSIPSTRFTGINTEVVGTPFTITLNCKDTGIGISGVFSDLSQLSNTSSYLNLTSDSTAQGVKVQLVYDDAIIAYDMPSAAGYSPNEVVIKAPDAALSSTFTITPKYVQTGNKVTGGTANAVAVVTFTYD